MIITCVVVVWLLCGLFASWFGHAVVDKGLVDTTAYEVFWMTLLGGCTLGAVLGAYILGLSEKFNSVVIFKAKK